MPRALVSHLGRSTPAVTSPGPQPTSSTLSERPHDIFGMNSSSVRVASLVCRRLVVEYRLALCMSWSGTGPRVVSAPAGTMLAPGHGQAAGCRLSALQWRGRQCGAQGCTGPAMLPTPAGSCRSATSTPA